VTVACWSNGSGCRWVVGALICPRHRRQLLILSIYTTVCLLSISSPRDASPHWMLETSCCVSPSGRVQLYCTAVRSLIPIVQLTLCSSQHIHQHSNHEDKCAPVFKTNSLRCSLSVSNTSSCAAHWLSWAACCCIKWLVSLKHLVSSLLLSQTVVLVVVTVCCHVCWYVVNKYVQQISYCCFSYTPVQVIPFLSCRTEYGKLCYNCYQHTSYCYTLKIEPTSLIVFTWRRF